MIEPSQFSLSGSETFIVCLASIAAKSTLLVGMAFLLDLVIGRRRVLIRSSLWNATLAALTVPKGGRDCYRPPGRSETKAARLVEAPAR